MSRMKSIFLTAGVSVGAVAGFLPQATHAAAAGSAGGVSAAAFSINQVWSQRIPDGNGLIALSSPNVATLADGQKAVVVGDRLGHLYAFHLSNGTAVPGWGGTAGVNVGAGVPIDSTPSVAGSGAGATVYVGVGNSTNVHNGGYLAVNAAGGRKWFTNAGFTPTLDATGNQITGSSGTAAVRSSLVVGNIQGANNVAAGGLGELAYALNGANGAVLNGFPWFQADSSFATPALLGGDLVLAGATSAGVAFNTTYQNGGHLTILAPTGRAGQPEGNGGFKCQFNTNEEIDSSPAVGPFGAGRATGIVFGTGSFFGGSDKNHVIAINPSCGQMWSAGLDGVTSSSPALVDALGNGQLQVAQGTDVNNSGGSAYLLNGANGAVIWRTPMPGAVIGSIVSADVNGDGAQDLLVPTTQGIEVLNGRNGAVLASLLGPGNLGFQNSPLVTDDPNGTLGITVAGYQPVAGFSEIVHFEVGGVAGSKATEAGAWPQFHHDPQLTGNVASSSAPPPAGPLEVPCSPPRGAPRGYLLTATDGGVFNFGNIPFCGSTGNITLNKPVVAGALTRNAGGYWLAASDGGIFNFGNARFFGSTGSIHLNQPIVGMAPTPDGRGYWLVASDGGIFSFGDARFFGSTGNIHLNKPIVGMASTPDGRGYWLVASDGGIFSFGDARFFGSTGNIHLNQPIVGMAPTPDGRGYWLVASDGGIFSFGDARFFGSTGNIHLNKPIVGMASTPDGRGYWLVASDGGIFSFGDARFFGSTGNIKLNKPVVGMEAAPGGRGYRLVASDGGIFSFGNAPFFGSMGGKPLNKPIVSLSGF